MTTTQKPAGLWALGPVIAKSLDGRNMLLVRRDNGATAAVDLNWEPFLPHLQVFRTVQGHARAITQSQASLSGREHLFRGALEKLLVTGIFVSAEEFIGRLAPGDAESEKQDPVTLVITTCDRPSCLDRLLESLIDNRNRFGGEWKCEVFDDSRGEGSRQQNRELVRNASQRIPLEYFGPDEQNEFLNWIGSHVDDPQGVLPWLLSSAHPENADLPTYGVPVNLAFLKHAGSRIVLIDDDTVARAWIRPDSKGDIRFGNSADSPLVAPGFEAATAKLKRYSDDPVAAHTKSIRLGLGELLRTGHAGAAAQSFEGAPYKDVVRLGAGSRVRYTRNGLVGDPGTVSDYTVFMPGARFLTTVAGDEKKYRFFREAQRCVFWGQRDHALVSSVKFQRATFAGIDLDPYMAPVLPTGRGEDSMIGSMLKFLYPRDFGLRFNFSLEHRPEVPRPWAISPQLLGYNPTAVEMATHYLNATQVPYDAEPVSKIEIFSDTLLRVMAKDKGREVFDRQIATYHEMLADHVAALNQALATTPKGCMTWKADVNAAVDFALKILRGPPPAIDTEASGKLKHVERFALAIPVWNQAFACCRERRQTAGD